MPYCEHTTRVFDPPVKSLFGLPRRRPGLALACFSVLLLGFQTALAQTTLSEYVSPVDPVEEYREAIDNIEADYGPYSEELTDMYLGLGQTLIDAGDYLEARDAFHRAVMVHRINQGPNSPEQTDHLYVLANIESVLGENSAADRVLNNIYHINAEHYGEDSAEMLPVLKRIYQWYHVTRPLGSELSEMEDFLRNVEVTGEILRISELVHGEQHPEAATAYRRYGEANFQMVMYLTGNALALGPEYYSGASSGGWLMSPDLESISVNDYYTEGRRAFRDYQQSLAANPSTTPAEFATAMAQIGDWYQLAEKYGKSIDHYEDGYRVLAQNEQSAEQAEQFMSQPEPMHFIFDISAIKLAETLTELEHSRIEVSMTVTTIGSLRSIEFLDAPEELTRSDLNRIKRGLERIPFRPAIKDGEVVTTKSFIWQFELAPGDSTS